MTPIGCLAARERGMAPVIPPKHSRKEAQEYDAVLFQTRHPVEKGFRKLKEWRGVATRYAKKAASYLAICRIRALALWAKVIWRHALRSSLDHRRLHQPEVPSPTRPGEVPAAAGIVSLHGFTEHAKPQ